MHRNTGDGRAKWRPIASAIVSRKSEQSPCPVGQGICRPLASPPCDAAGVLTITREQRHALELLAAAGSRGITEAALIAHGCRVDTLAELLRTGLASMTLESMLAGDKTIEVVRIKITEAGRLETPNRPPGRSP